MWIPITERLPAKNQKVLGWDQGWHQVRLYIYYGRRDSGYHWWITQEGHDWSNIHEWEMTDTPTHWMPLPDTCKDLPSDEERERIYTILCDQEDQFEEPES